MTTLPTRGPSNPSTAATTSSNPAETYERFMVPPLFRPAAAQLLAIVQPKPGDRVLDVGCGTGIVARLAAPSVSPGGTIAGLDINPQMLAVARTSAEREGLAIDWQEGQAEALPFPAASFDLVLSQLALMFFADRAKALAEMHRVLVPGGRAGLLVMQGIEHHPFYQALDEAISRRLGISPVADIFSLGRADDLRRLLKETGFHAPEIVPETIDARFANPEAFLAGEIDVDTAAIPAMQKLDSDARQALVNELQDDMVDPLRAVTEGDFVHIPFHVHIVSASR